MTGDVMALLAVLQAHSLVTQNLIGLQPNVADLERDPPAPILPPGVSFPTFCPFPFRPPSSRSSVFPPQPYTDNPTLASPSRRFATTGMHLRLPLGLVPPLLPTLHDQRNPDDAESVEQVKIAFCFDIDAV